MEWPSREVRQSLRDDRWQPRPSGSRPLYQAQIGPSRNLLRTSRFAQHTQVNRSFCNGSAALATVDRNEKGPPHERTGGGTAAAQPWFVLGAASASFAWFAPLGYGARLLAAALRPPRGLAGA